MKYLKINDNKGYYLKLNEGENNNWIEVDKINKDDLMNLINKALEPDFEMDEYKEEDLGNKAHQIIYRNIHEKFLNLIKEKDRFKDESSSLYRDAIEKYSN